MEGSRVRRRKRFFNAGDDSVSRTASQARQDGSSQFRTDTYLDIMTQNAYEHICKQFSFLMNLADDNRTDISKRFLHHSIKQKS